MFSSVACVETTAYNEFIGTANIFFRKLNGHHPNNCMATFVTHNFTFVTADNSNERCQCCMISDAINLTRMMQT